MTREWEAVENTICLCFYERRALAAGDLMMPFSLRRTWTQFDVISPKELLTLTPETTILFSSPTMPTFQSWLLLKISLILNQVASVVKLCPPFTLEVSQKTLTGIILVSRAISCCTLFSQAQRGKYTFRSSSSHSESLSEYSTCYLRELSIATIISWLWKSPF